MASTASVGEVQRSCLLVASRSAKVVNLPPVESVGPGRDPVSLLVVHSSPRRPLVPVPSPARAQRCSRHTPLCENELKIGIAESLHAR